MLIILFRVKIGIGLFKRIGFIYGEIKENIENDIILGNIGIFVIFFVFFEVWYSVVFLMSVRGFGFRYNDIKKLFFLIICCVLGIMLEVLYIVNFCSNFRKGVFILFYR